MVHLLCPLCGQRLTAEEHRMRCSENHCFDIARQGYVNLLPVNHKHSLHPGDTKEQVAARRSFLDGGYYAPIAQAVREAALEFCPHAQTILDVGCGEGYYSAQVAAGFPGATLYGLDISKDAVRLASGKYKGGHWLCGTAAKLPFDGGFDLLLSLFALTIPQEFRRVLTDHGIFIQVLAAEDHLLGLKEVIYPELLFKEKDSVPDLPGFRRIVSRSLRFSFAVAGEQIGHLLSMTPHFWRIGKDGALRLQQLTRLSDTASVIINVFTPN